MLAGLGDCDPNLQSCYMDNPAVYGQNGGYQPLPNTTPVGSGGSIPLACDPTVQSCPEAITPPHPPVGTGGSAMTGAYGGYTPPIDYGAPMQSTTGGQVAVVPQGGASISIVSEAGSSFLSFFQGTILGLPRWLVFGLGAAAAYKLAKGSR